MASQAGGRRLLDRDSFNVESGGADADVVDEQIALIDGVDLWGFSEVGAAEAANLFEVAAVCENTQCRIHEGRGPREAVNSS